MTGPPVTWSRALRALSLACASLLLLTFALANFVLVDARLWLVNVQLRLAWAVVGAAVLGFAAGALWSRTGQSRSIPMERSCDADGRSPEPDRVSGAPRAAAAQQ
jgi:hypothetical protein